MPITSIRLPEDLKNRITQAAERAGTTSHAFMLNAIAERVTEDERRNDFYDSAQRRYAEIVASGMTIPWSEMRIHLEHQLAGRATSRPAARKLTL